MTQTEKLLWQKLRRKQLGVTIRRQMPFVFGKYKYIVDFYCAKYKLVIEIDGSVHETQENKVMDEFREDVFKFYGYRILRFKNDEVKENIEEVVLRIKGFINPSPRLKGTKAERSDGGRGQVGMY